METVNLAAKLSLITDFWSPRTVGAINDCRVKLVKLKGEFVLHAHEEAHVLLLEPMGFAPATVYQKALSAMI
jgi:hypothetical protein